MHHRCQVVALSVIMRILLGDDDKAVGFQSDNSIDRGMNHHSNTTTTHVWITSGIAKKCIDLPRRLWRSTQ